MFLGIEIQDINLAPEGPAYQAGLKLTDLIVNVNKIPVFVADDLPSLIANIKPGIELEVAVLPNVKSIFFKVILDELTPASSS